MIELFMKPLQIYILPKINKHPCLKKPSIIYLSRKSTVRDLRAKMAEILR